MKKGLSILLAVILCAIGFAYADEPSTIRISELPDAMSFPEMAAVVLNDYETAVNGSLPVLGCSVIRYRMNNAESLVLAYYVNNPDRALYVFPQDGESAKISSGDINLTSGKLNESTAEAVHKSVVDSYRNSGIEVVAAEYIKAGDITRAWAALSRPAPETEETGIYGEWFNIKGSDMYTFHEDGTGTHDALSIMFTQTGEQIAVLENVTDIQPNMLTIDQTMGFTRLISGDTYYVREQEYNRLGTVVREQTTKILTGVEFWKAAAAINYLQFTEDGGGWFLVENETDPLQWEFVDNDTIRMTVNTSVGEHSLVVNVVNNNGSYQLMDDNGVVKYTPRK